MPKKKKILMISFHTAQNLGLRSLASILKKEYVVHYLYFVNLVNIHFKTNNNNIPLSILTKFSKSYDFIFISSTSYNKKYVFLVADTLKEANPNTIIIIGGNLSIHEPNECLEHADYVCVWEGHTILELLRQINSKKEDIAVDNFISKKNRKITYSMPKSLDDVLIPDYSRNNNYFLFKDRIVKKEFRPKKLTFRTSIGCIYSCSFCYINHINKIKAENHLPLYQEMGIKQVIKSMEKIKKITNAKLVRIVDDNFFYRDLDQIVEFVKEYNQKINLPLNVDTDPRSKDFIAKFDALTNIKKKLNILFGVQTGSEKFNAKSYRRLQKNSVIVDNHNKMLDIIRRKKAKVKLVYTFIYNNPTENEETLMETINLMLKLRKSSIMLMTLSLMPGTELKKNMLSYYNDLNNLGEINYGHFRIYGYYYFMFHIIKFAYFLGLDFLLPKKMSNNYFTKFMNNFLFSPFYYMVVKLVYIFYELEMKIIHGYTY